MVRSGSLIGFCKIAVEPFGWTLVDCPVNVSNGRAWASPPSKACLDRQRQVIRDDRGRVKYASMVEFASRDDRDRFSEAVVALVRRKHPRAFDDADAGAISR